MNAWPWMTDQESVELLLPVTNSLFFCVYDGQSYCDLIDQLTDKLHNVDISLKKWFLQLISALCRFPGKQKNVPGSPLFNIRLI